MTAPPGRRVLVNTLGARDSGSAGVRRYMSGLLENFEHDIRSRIVLVCSASNEHLFSRYSDYSRLTLPWRTERPWVRMLTQQICVPILAVALHVGLVFEPVDHVSALCFCPIVTTLHSSHINLEHGLVRGIRAAFNAAWLRVTLRRSVRIIAISEYVRRMLETAFKCDPNTVIVIYHGGGLVEQALKTGWEPPPILPRQGGVLFVGTLYAHKGARELVHAFAETVKEVEDSWAGALHIVGRDEGGMAAQLGRLARSHGIERRVIYHGTVSDERLLDLIASAEVLVLPSRAEGFGLPLVEAMQAGTPIVTSNATSPPEIVKDAGLCVDCRDASELSRALTRVLTSPQVKQQLSAAGLRRGRTFSWVTAATQTSNVLLEVLRDKGGA